MADSDRQQMHPSFVNVIRQRERIRASLSKIKHRIGVYSAKGGVGKTTVAINLAYALTRSGKKVGILDADIDTPNVPLFLGIREKMDTSGFPLKPFVKEGVRIASTAMIVDDSSRPIIWRGPMIVKMLGDFLENTDWGELDYLIIDLAPGTSDSPLTIMQLMELDGFIIVTTPQRTAAVNSIKSGIMAKRLNAPIMGIVENMSRGEASESTAEAAEALGSRVIGTISENAAYDSYSDSGKVPVIEDKGIMEEFNRIAEGILREQ